MTVMFDRCGEDSEGIGAGQAICMALMESFGIVKMIDDACEWDEKQRILSPGKAVKAIAGTMFTCNPKQAMSNVALFCSGSPVDMLFGPRVTLESLSDSALGRALDTIFETDIECLFYSICAKVKAYIGLDPKMYHFDPTNVTIDRSAGDEYMGLPVGAPVPKLGHPKDGRKGCVQYNVSCAVDEFGLPAYVRTYDGNTDDTKMISDAVRFVENAIGDRRMIAVGDSKMTHWNLVDHMCTHGTHFVSKPPQNFADSAREKVVAEAFRKGFTDIGAIGSRKDSPEFEIHDTDMKCKDRTLRFIVCRKKDRSKMIRHMKRVEGSQLNDLMKSMAHMSFKTEDDARAAYRETVKAHIGKGYDIIPTFRSRRAYGGGTEWKATFKIKFNEARAKDLAASNAEVLITSLPRASVTSDDPTQGITSRDVMRIYMGQWKIENLFGTMKSGMGADDVYFQNPQREAVMIFIIALAALVRSVMKIRLRSCHKEFAIPGNITAERMFLLIQNVSVRYRRAEGRLYLDGTPNDRQRTLSFIDAIGVDTSTLLG